MTFKAGGKPKVITSARQLEKLTEPGRYRDPDVKGLYLQIVSAANRSWVLRYQFDKQPRNMGLGPYPTVGLQAARNKAREIRESIALRGVDPLASRQEQQAARDAARAKVQTFREASERYFQKKVVEWKTEDQRRAYKSAMRDDVFPIIGDMDVAAVDTAAVLRVLEPIWQSKPTAASLLRVRLEGVLATATVGGFRTGDNPARWKGHLAEMLPAITSFHEVQHHAALPYEDAPEFMARLRAETGVAAKALEFIMLNGCRLQEGLQAQWAEIDRDARLWTISKVRWKMGKKFQQDHIVPLSDAAMALLDSLPTVEGNPFIFPGRDKGKPISGPPVRQMGQRLCDVKMTPHGFRSTFADWAFEKTEFKEALVDIALSHKIGDATDRAYRRGSAIERRRELMVAWAEYCGGFFRGDPGAEIVAPSFGRAPPLPS